MKLVDDRPVIETYGHMEEKLFSIEDTGMIFDILRNKMYSDPVRAICREISSNARDAHREVGKENVACEITLPNAWDPHYKIKDFGPGISPERMHNVFIKYTASTKRNDNTQTGGFGLGAKTPFSYSDAFRIETVHNGIFYDYSCFIDESKVGKLSLLNKQITDAPNGTEIIIPVKKQDFNKFIDDTEFVTRHWDVRPIIKGATFNYKNIVPNLKGNNYAICKSNSNSVIREVKLVVDGVEYPLDLNQLKEFASTKVLDTINGTVYLYFGVGELSLSATREAVHLDKITQGKIADRLDVILKDLIADVQKNIDAQPDLWSANLWVNTQLHKTFSNLNVLGQLSWKGTPLTIGRLSIKDSTVFVFTKGKHSRGQYYPDKIARTTQHSIDFVENAQIYLCDLSLKEPQIKNVSKAFDGTSTKYVYVVQAKPKFSPKDPEVKIEDIAKDHNLLALGAKQLSSITKVGKTYSISGVRLLVFKFSLSDNTFKQVSYSSMEEDTNKKVIASLEREYNGARTIVLKNKKYLSSDITRSLVQMNTDYSIYGVDSAIPADKLEEHFDDFTPIDDFIEEKVFANAALDFFKIKNAFNNQWNLDRYFEKLDTYKSKIFNKDSLFIKYVDLNTQIRDIINTQKGIINIYESIKGPITEKEVATWLVKNPDFDLKTFKDKMQKAYPLLAYLDHYNGGRLAEPIIHYINLIDKN